MVIAAYNSNMKNLYGKSILVVDDDTRWLCAVDKGLAGEGAVTTTAQCAGEVLNILTARPIPIDLLITDLRMPCVTGLTLVYSIRKIFPELPIIVLTAFGNPELKAECLSQSAVSFVEKPLDTTQLLKAIDDVFALN
jgi:DNA-binding NtrC family response regulator